MSNLGSITRSLPLCILAIIASGAGCGGKEVKKAGASGTQVEEIEELEEIDPNVLISKTAAPTTDIELQLDLKSSGQVLHLLDATALKDAFSPIFGLNPRTAAVGTFFAANPTEYFTPLEKQDLGTFSYVANEAALQNYATVTTPSLIYLRTLRGFLLDACGRFVTAEYARLATQPALNQLIKSKLPAEADISAFMSKVYGLELATGFHRGAKEYEGLFKKLYDEGMQAANPVEATIIQDQYMLLCIAVGSDSRTFMR